MNADPRTVRIFLSSTFHDFQEERNLLVKKVFPALRARLKGRFVEIVDVDLRWGITVEEAERGEVLPICLAEIDRARPYFVGMLVDCDSFQVGDGSRFPCLVGCQHQIDIDFRCEEYAGLIATIRLDYVEACPTELIS